MRYLTRYWRSRVEKLNGVRFFANDDQSCGLGIFEVTKVDAGKLQKELWERHQILVQHMSGGKRQPNLSGIRVTPNVYTTAAELDRFIDALVASIKTLSA